MEVEKAVLGAVDYVIFTFMLLVSTGIGVYFRFSGGKQKTTEEYLLAGKDMAILPVAFSLMASYASAISVIGIPGEMYKFGLHIAYMNVGFVIGFMLSSYLSLPVFFGMQAATAYEYLERRFGKVARTITSLAFVAQMVIYVSLLISTLILYMSVVLYAPALALSAVTSLSTWVSVISIGVVCTFYCTLGGMKAVLWTDVFQAILMFLGIIAILVKGIIDVGGLGNVYKRAYEGGRLDPPTFDFDPETRYTVWNLLAQGITYAMAYFGGNQVQIQRLLTVKNISRSRKALFVSIPLCVGFHLLNCLVGIVIYAYFYECDPLTAPNKPISSADQIMPYFMMVTLGGYPGLPGLCICGIFSASLSSVSSAVNSLAAVTMQDLVKPAFISRGFSQKNMAFIAKVITFLYGVLFVAMTFLVASLGNLIQAVLTVVGMLGGPVLAIFLLGMLTTRTNEKGAVFGVVCAIGIAAWVSFGATANAPPPKTLPVSIDGCSALNMLPEFMSNSTISSASTASISLASTIASESIIDPLTDDISPIYKISYMWFGPIGFGSAIIIGYIASVLISLITGEHASPPEELLSPLLLYFMTKKSYEPDNKEVKMEGQLEL